MCPNYSLTTEEDGGFYACDQCGNYFFSLLEHPVHSCLDCLLDVRYRRSLLSNYGPTERELLDQNTLRTQSQVAGIMGISRQRVQQIELVAMAKVRAHLIKKLEIHIILTMNSVAIAGRLVRDIRVQTGNQSGNKFLAGTILTEEEGKEGKIFKTYWDYLGFGDRNLNKESSLKDGAAVYATGRVQGDTYTGKDGETRARLKVVGDIGVISGLVAEPAAEDSPF